MCKDFFSRKRPWSRYKDFILRYYLEPYLAKVNTLGKPILIVDCFAGCGQFGDGETGSPVIISEVIQKAWPKRKVPIRAEFIEADPNIYGTLTECLQPFREFTSARLGTFDEVLPELAERAKANTVFLYVDPYTVKGLVFSRMKAVYDAIHQASASVEILLNLNGATFMRWALAAIKANRQGGEQIGAADNDDEADYQADDPAEIVDLTVLDDIAGGKYWKEIANDATTSFPEKLEQFTDGYLQKLVDSFPYAASYEFKAKYEHKVPKYALVYGTRHPDGVALMNDAMCKARLEFLGNEFSKGKLFDFTPEIEIPDMDQLRESLISIIKEAGPLKRKIVVNRLIFGSYFGKVETKTVRRVIGDLVKANRLISDTGTFRINDDAMLSCQPSA